MHHKKSWHFIEEKKEIKNKRLWKEGVSRNREETKVNVISIDSIYFSNHDDVTAIENILMI